MRSSRSAATSASRVTSGSRSARNLARRSACSLRKAAAAGFCPSSAFSMTSSRASTASTAAARAAVSARRVGRVLALRDAAEVEPARQRPQRGALPDQGRRDHADGREQDEVAMRKRMAARHSGIDSAAARLTAPRRPAKPIRNGGRQLGAFSRLRKRRPQPARQIGDGKHPEEAHDDHRRADHQPRQRQRRPALRAEAGDDLAGLQAADQEGQRLDAPGHQIPDEEALQARRRADVVAPVP